MTVHTESLVGPKTSGIELAAIALGREPGGFVISTSMVDSALRESGYGYLWSKILLLDQEPDLQRKLELASLIELYITKEPLPEWFSRLVLGSIDRHPEVELWAIRSSSIDEQEARGIHKTLLGVSRSRCLAAVKRCIASYYCQDAVNFRVINGAGDLPYFAILVQPYRRGEGGVAEVLPGGGQYAISVGSTPVMVTAGKPGVREWEGATEEEASAEGLGEVVEILKELEATFGLVQIEWVRVPGGVEVLQMNLISPPRDMIRKEGKPEHHLKIGSLRELPRLQVFLENHPYGLVSLELGEIINLNSFQGELIAIIAVYGNRISSISTTQTVLPSSHLANNCRTFGIELISR